MGLPEQTEDMVRYAHVLLRVEVPLEHVTEQADHGLQLFHEGNKFGQSSILQLTTSTALSPL